jgi:hypothetical protein
VAFADLSFELSGYLPGLSAFLADTWITRAWRAIRDRREWSFLIVDDAIVCPPQVTAGTYAITQYSNVVTADSVASPAFTATLNAVIAPQNLQLRWQGAEGVSEIYSIVSVNTTNPNALVFTLDRAVVEPTAAQSPYLLYRPYITVPVPDFRSWISVVDMTNGWTVVGGRNVVTTSSDFDQLDPQREALGQAYRLGYYKGSSDIPPIPIYELWPGPTEGQTFYVRYRIRGIDFAAPTDVQPDLIPDALIVQYALAHYAYPWAAANVGHFPAMAKVNFIALAREARDMIYGNIAQRRVGLLKEVENLDDSQVCQSVFRRGHGLRNAQPYPWPIDANFEQSHLIPQ